MRTRLCFLDIETFPILGYAWGPKWETNLLKEKTPIRLASFAYKWAGEKTVHCVALPDLAQYEVDRESDRELVQELWEIFDKAQIIVAHNGKAFDIKQSNAFFARHHMKPPSWYVVIDTKTEAKKYFRFSSNSLDDLGEYLNVGRKERTGGIDLWWDCMDGKPEAWKKMKRYNKQDVVLLEKVYEQLRPWMKTHPNLNVYEDRVMSCKYCLSMNLIRRGNSPRKNGHVPQWFCKDCTGWNYGKFVSYETIIR